MSPRAWYSMAIFIMTMCCGLPVSHGWPSIRTVFAGSEFRAIGKMAVGGSGAYITDVMTMPEARRQGLGEAIMRALHADARVAGVTVAALTSTAMAEPLYERLGYLRVGTVTLFATPERE